MKKALTAALALTALACVCPSSHAQWTGPYTAPAPAAAPRTTTYYAQAAPQPAYPTPSPSYGPPTYSYGAPPPATSYATPIDSGAGCSSCGGCSTCAPPCQGPVRHVAAKVHACFHPCTTCCSPPCGACAAPVTGHPIIDEWRCKHGDPAEVHHYVFPALHPFKAAYVAPGCCP